MLSPPPPLQESWGKPRSISAWKIGQGHLYDRVPLSPIERFTTRRASSEDLLLFDRRGEGEVERIGLGWWRLVMTISTREYLLVEYRAVDKGCWNLGILLMGCSLEGVHPSTLVSS
jgi:hypothetical protein